jgi:hypothetical protein
VWPAGAGQRELVFGVVLAPSVIESPSATTAPSRAGAATLTPDRNHHCPNVAVGVTVRLPVTFPAATTLSWKANACVVVALVGRGR